MEGLRKEEEILIFEMFLPNSLKVYSLKAYFGGLFEQYGRFKETN